MDQGIFCGPFQNTYGQGEEVILACLFRDNSLTIMMLPSPKSLGLQGVLFCICHLSWFLQKARQVLVLLFHTE